MHELRDVELGQPVPQCSRDELEDLLSFAHRVADEVDLHGRLAASEGIDDRCRRDETVREPGVRERLLELEPEPVRQAVRGRIAPRVVQRDRAGRESFQRLTQRGLDALVVADHVVAADLLTAGASKRPTIATRSPVAEMTNAPVQALYVPAIRSRHGSLVSIVSRTSVSQTSVSCGEVIAGGITPMSV